MLYKLKYQRVINYSANTKYEYVCHVGYMALRDS